MQTNVISMDGASPGRVSRRLSWVAQLVAAFILGQSLFFKFSGAPEAVHIFQTLGVEPWGRLLTAAVELGAVILLLLPGRATWGASLASAVMLGAIGSHLFVLGIAVQGDGGTLFGMGLVVLICSLAILWLRRGELPGMSTAD